MSQDRREQRRRERQRRRRAGRQQNVTYEPVGRMQMPGIMGWFQRNPRFFYVGGIAVMVLSLGAVFFGTQGGIHSGQPTAADVAPTQAPAPSATAPDTSTAEAGAEPSPTEDPIQRVYSAPPSFDIDVSHSYEVVILTEKGEIRIELLPAEAPGYVNNFVFLARNHFYDGLTFHRVVEGFVAQAGDPTATGFSSAGYNLPEEKNDLEFDAGVLSMAKAGTSVNGSQFFITLEPAAHLNGQFTIFGRVTEGLDVVRALTKREPGAGQPPGDRILSIEVLEDGVAGSG